MAFNQLIELIFPIGQLNMENNIYESNNLNEVNNNISFRCYYEISDYNEVQIINNKFINYINEDIESKIKILNNNKKEKLIFKKRFYKIGINTVDFLIEGKLDDMSFMFNECSSLKEIKFINFDTTQVSKMFGLFRLCKGLEYLDLSNFNTSNVTDMSYMFCGCSILKEIKGINNFNTSKVTIMEGMFTLCNKLENLDLSNFNTSNITNMICMFNKCSNLKEIKGINNFNTSKVTNMKAMFQECSELKFVDLSGFNTSKVTDMAYMFAGCNKLKEIKGINTFDTINVINMEEIFKIVLK